MKYELKRNKIVGSELNKLERKVLRIVNEEDEPQDFLQDVCQYGCQSGMVSELIYYTDTLKWFAKYRSEIEDQLIDLKDGCDMTQDQLNGWDESDPFVRETNNRNLLAWFSFETVCSDILISLEG